MGTKVTRYRTGKDGKTRRVPDAPAKPAEAGSPGPKPGDDKNKPAENPPKGA